jgi:NTP pyrophosphatase (non-canonical NTP hydrolase)
MTDHLTIAQLVELAHGNAVAKRFYDPGGPALAFIPEKLALIHSEVSEALECIRSNPNPKAKTITAAGKPEGFGPELADIVIRVADLCGAWEIDLEAEVAAKMAYNSTRPPKHGRRF